MGIGREFLELSEKLNYSFCDTTLIQTALTHVSFANEMKAKGIHIESNESLEFLGDAVLQIIVSNFLYEKFSKQGEGALTQYRQFVVCESTLALIARKLDIGVFLNIGTGEEHNCIRDNEKVLADALEAIIAAVFLDDTKNSAGALYNNVVLRLFSSILNSLEKFKNTDYKTLLQELVEKNRGDELSYVISSTGPQHCVTFHAIAYVNNNKVGEGDGKTKRIAEMQAAKAALCLFGIV